jgi:hypothetical protein
MDLDYDYTQDPDGKGIFRRPPSKVSIHGVTYIDNLVKAFCWMYVHTYLGTRRGPIYMIVSFLMYIHILSIPKTTALLCICRYV